MNVDAMVDLETLGTRPGCVVLSIGAVVMTPKGLGATFYVNLDSAEQQLNGLTTDPDTVDWWDNQPSEAQAPLLLDVQDPHVGLLAFSDWCYLNDVRRVWGNGASFDNTILVAAYEKLGIKVPWKFYNDRCYRTLKGLRRDIRLDRVGTHHHALDDARSQALHAVKILNAINGWETKPWVPSSWRARLSERLSAVFKTSSSSKALK